MLRAVLQDIFHIILQCGILRGISVGLCQSILKDILYDIMLRVFIKGDSHRLLCSNHSEYFGVYRIVYCRLYCSILSIIKARDFGIMQYIYIYIYIYIYFIYILQRTMYIVQCTYPEGMLNTQAVVRGFEPRPV